MNGIVCPEYMLGLTLLTMQYLPNWGVSYPTNSFFDPFSERKLAGDLSVRGDGFGRAYWEWQPAVARDEMAILLSFIPDGYASSSVYIRTRVNKANGVSFANFTATLVLPVFGEGGDGGTPSEQNIAAYESARVNFVGLVAL